MRCRDHSFMVSVMHHFGRRQSYHGCERKLHLQDINLGRNHTKDKKGPKFFSISFSNTQVATLSTGKPQRVHRTSCCYNNECRRYNLHTRNILTVCNLRLHEDRLKQIYLLKTGRQHPELGYRDISKRNEGIRQYNMTKRYGSQPRQVVRLHIPSIMSGIEHRVDGRATAVTTH